MEKLNKEQLVDVLNTLQRQLGVLERTIQSLESATIVVPKDELDYMLELLQRGVDSSIRTSKSGTILSENTLVKLKMAWDKYCQRKNPCKLHALTRLWGFIRSCRIDTNQFGTYTDFVEFMSM